MNAARIVIILMEIFLMGLNARLIFCSFTKSHWDAVLAEISYGLFIFYAVWRHGTNLEAGITLSLILSAIAGVIGIAGLIGIVRKFPSESYSTKFGYKYPTPIR